MCHFVKSTLRGLFRETLKGFICLELYNNPLLASPSFPVLPWISLMSQLLNSASWMESLFMCFVLYMPQFPEQAGPCMLKPQSFCPVLENAGRARRANQHAPLAHLLTSPPPAQLRGGGGDIKLKFSFLFSEASSVWTGATSYRDGLIGPFCINDWVCGSKFRTVAFTQQDP